MGLRYLGGNVGHPLAAELSSGVRSDPRTSSEKRAHPEAEDTPVVTIHAIFQKKKKNQAEGRGLTAKVSSHFNFFS